MKRRINIAIIRPDGNPLPSGFYNSQEIGLAKGLAKHNCNVDIYMASATGNHVTEIIQADNDTLIRVFHMPCIILPQIAHAIYPGLINALRSNSYDLVQVNEENELTCFWVARYCHYHSITCVVYQGMYQPITGRIRAFFQYCYDRLLLPSFRRNISQAIAKTNRAKEYLESKGFNKPFVVPVGLDMKIFTESCAIDWRGRLNLSEEKRVLLYVGVFEQRRNVHFLVDLAVRLEASGFTLLMVGDGPQFDEINLRLMNESVNNIHLLGKVKQAELSGLYSIADYFLLASSYEIYGMVLLEALCSGCPVIATRTAGSDDLIVNGVNGILLDSLDTAHWENAVLDNIEKFDRELIQAESATKYSWANIAGMYLSKIYPKLKVISGGRTNRVI